MEFLNTMYLSYIYLANSSCYTNPAYPKEICIILKVNMCITCCIVRFEDSRFYLFSISFLFFFFFAFSFSSLFWELGLGFSMTCCCHKIVTQSCVIIKDGRRFWKDNIIQHVIYMLILRQIYSHLGQANVVL